MKAYKYGLVIGLVMLNVLGFAQNLQFDANFENGRLDTAYLYSGHYRLWPITNLHARVTGLQGQQPQFAIFDSLGYQLRSYHHMVYREEGTNQWQFFDTAYKAGTTSYYYFQNQQSFTVDTIYLAYWAPYTYSDLQAFMNSMVNDRNVIPWIAGTSYQGRNLYAFEISDTSYLDCYKQKVVITARQHPVEHINGYFIEGMANYLRSNDSLATELRKRFRFLFYPMCNPDGVYNGSGQNALGQGLNREWADSLAWGGTPEVDSIKQDIWFKTDSAFDYGIDIHANAGSNLAYYWWGFTSSSGVDSNLLNRAEHYVQAVALVDTSSNQGTSLYQNYIQGNGVNSSKTAANWFYRSGGAVAFTFEPTSEPLGFSGDNALGVDRYRLAGASLAKGFRDLGDSIEPMRGFVALSQISGAWLSAEGGKPPYQFYWESLAGGPSDTTRFISFFGGGLTRVRITDANGCVFERVVNVPYMNMPEHSFSIKLYPNPNEGSFKIEVPGGVEEAHLSLYRYNGQKVWEGKYKFLEKLNLDLDLAPGYYLLQIQSKTGKVGQPLIIKP